MESPRRQYIRIRRKYQVKGATFYDYAKVTLLTYDCSSMLEKTCLSCQLQDEPLLLDRLLATIEDITQDDQLVRLGIVEIPHIIQCHMKFSVKAVNISGDVVFHGFIVRSFGNLS